MSLVLPSMRGGAALYHYIVCTVGVAVSGEVLDVSSVSQHEEVTLEVSTGQDTTQRCSLVTHTGTTVFITSNGLTAATHSAKDKSCKFTRHMHFL